jgi:hypothetical protein
LRIPEAHLERLTDRQKSVWHFTQRQLPFPVRVNMTTAGAQRMVREKPEVMELKSTEDTRPDEG